VPAVKSILPESLTPAFLSKIVGMFTKDKNDRPEDYMFFIDEALKNPEMVIQLLNNQYLYGMVTVWLDKDQKAMVDQLRPYLRLVLQALKNPDIRRALNWPIVKSDAIKVKKALAGKDRELEKLSAEIESETKKH
jgi:hypothetical protein